MKYLLDPRAFNVLIMVMFAAASVRWAFARNWAQAGYWASACLLNLFVTMMGRS